MNCQGQFSHFKDTIATHVNSFGRMHEFTEDIVDADGFIASTIHMPPSLSHFDALTSTRTAAPTPPQIDFDKELSPTAHWTHFNESDFLVNFDEMSGDDDDDSDYKPDNDDDGSNSSSNESRSSDSSSLSQSDQMCVESGHSSNQGWDQLDTTTGAILYY